MCLTYVTGFYIGSLISLMSLWIIFISVPQQGSLDIITEFGRLHAEPNEIVVIQVLSSDEPWPVKPVRKFRIILI